MITKTDKFRRELERLGELLDSLDISILEPLTVEDIAPFYSLQHTRSEAELAALTKSADSTTTIDDAKDIYCPDFNYHKRMEK